MSNKAVSNKKVTGMEFERWQIKIKKHGLGHTIPWKYIVQRELCKK